jgi:hypothetical protein
MHWRPVISVLTVLAISFVVITVALAPVCFAGVRWTTDGIGVRSQPATGGHALWSQMAADGSGGAFIVWADQRSFSKTDIYAQRVDANGNCLWTADGIGVRSQPDIGGDARYPTIVPDSSGGAVITWMDYRSGSKCDIYAQRVDANGNCLWAADGVGVRSQPSITGDANFPQISSDGSGGTVITWEDKRAGSTWGVYAQRVDANGNCMWTADGVMVRAKPGTWLDAMSPQITSDNSGGTIVTWEDNRAVSAWGVYAQRLDANGNYLWAADGVGVRSLSGTASSAYSPLVATDESGGAIISWEDERSGSKSDIYAQRLDANGNCMWASAGVGMRFLPDTAGDAYFAAMAPDGSGGAVTAWMDRRSSDKDEIYAQRVDANGNCLWSTDGVGVRSQPDTASNATFPKVAPDGSGGAVITWQDYRSGSKCDIYAQRVDANGDCMWTADGVGIRSQPDTLYNAGSPQLVSDGCGGAIISWEDYRRGYQEDLYAQRISDDAPTVTSITPSSGIGGGSVQITNLAGTNFQIGASVRLELGSTLVNATDVNVVAGNKITCKFVLPGTLGKYDVVVKNRDGQEARFTGGFSVKNICGQGAGAVAVGFGLMMGLLSLGGSGFLRRRFRRKSL